MNKTSDLVCRVCENTLNFSAFSEYNIRKNDYKCKKCAYKLQKNSPTFKAAQQRYRKSPKGRCYLREQNKRTALRGRKLLTLLKTRPCTDCKGWFEPCQMQFDHRDRTTKSGLVSDFLRVSTKRLLEEVAKCDVVCANCHALRTHVRQDWKPLTSTCGN